MSDRPRVLFLCIGNACRSPMAEGFLRELAADRFRSESGGVRPIGVQPMTVQVMEEVGIDISDLRSTYVHHHLEEPPEHLIALSRTALRHAPEIPAGVQVECWPVPDPFTVEGDEPTRLAAYRRARDEIRARIEEWLRA